MQPVHLNENAGKNTSKIEFVVYSRVPHPKETSFHNRALKKQLEKIRMATGQQHKTTKHDKANCGNPSARECQHGDTSWNPKGYMLVPHARDQTYCWKGARKSGEGRPPVRQKETNANIRPRNGNVNNVYVLIHIPILAYLKNNKGSLVEKLPSYGM